MEKINLQKQSELYIIYAASRQELLDKLIAFEKFLDPLDTNSVDASHILSSSTKRNNECLSIVAVSAQDLRKKLAYAVKKLAEVDCSRIYEKSGIYYFKEKLAQKGKLAFLFPGEGSQYQNMLLELSVYFPEIRRSFEITDAACSVVDGFLPSQYVFPVKNREGELEEELWKMEGAVESVVSANYAMTALLKKLKITPDCLVGHSSGEFSALENAGVIRFKDEKERIDYIRAGYVLIKELTAQTQILEGILVAVGAVTRSDIESAIEKIASPIFIAMENCSHQYVLCGSRISIEKIVQLLSKQGAICNILPFNRPYHTAWFKQALKPLKDFFERYDIFTPKIPIYSCATASLYPSEPKQIRSVAVGQWAMPVRFQETIETIYENGVRIFVEVGPRGNLTGFVDNILKDKVHLAVPLDKIYQSGITQLNHALGLLAATGVEMELDYFYNRVPLSLFNQISNNDERDKKNILSTTLPEIKLKNEFSGNLHFQSSINRPYSAPIVTAADGVLLNESKDHSQQVLDLYFQTMENFVAVQGNIMRAYFGGESPKKETSRKFPLIGEILELKPRENLIATRDLNIDEDIFLDDHAFGNFISNIEPELKALPVLPLTVSIEILAEAASLLFPEKILIRMENVRAYKWISFETGKASVQIKATYKAGQDFEKVFVEIRQTDSSKNETIGSFLPLLVEGTAVFAEAYPFPPKTTPILFKNETIYNFSASEIYPKRLFHGPRFQSVKSITRWGEDGFEGTIQVLDRTELFRLDSRPGFVTDPVLLDGMGSLLGLWAAREPWNGFVLFPFQVKTIHFFKSSLLMPGETLKFQLRILSTNETTLVSDIDLLENNGEVLIRMEGWEDRNFYVTKPLHRFSFQAIENTLSSPLVAIEKKLSEKGKFTFCILEEFPDDFFQRHHRIWEKMLAFLIFNKQEKQQWQSMEVNEKSRIQYLLGRAVAKDAVRLYLKNNYGLKLGPADVIIKNDKKGRPFATGAWIDKVSSFPHLSISHTGMVFIAAAGKGAERGIGIDIENSSNLNEALRTEVFSEEERRLASSNGLNTLECLTKFWCAKEAFSKALGSGMIYAPRDIEVKMFDRKTEKVIMEARQDWIKEFPFLQGLKIETYTFTKGDLAIAACLL